MPDPTPPASENTPTEFRDADTTRTDATSGEAGGSIGPYRLLQKIGEGAN